jgi:two-component system, cell cycle sensor histidine kinase and response regulator CckA
MPKKISYDELQLRIKELEQAESEPKQADEALFASQQIVKEIISSIPASVFWKDMDLAYLGCNKGFAQNAGLADPKDIVGKDDYQLVWRDQAESYRRDDRQVIKSGCARYSIEESLTTSDGNNITLLTNKIPLHNSKGEICGVLGISMDITERKRAEDALLINEERFRTTLDATPFPIFVVDTNHDRVLYSSKSVFEIFGYIASTVSEWYEIAYPDPEYRAEVIERGKPFLEQARKSKKPVNTGEYRIACADGSERICEIWIAFIKDRLIISSKDVTNHIVVKKALKESEERYSLAMRASQDGLFDWNLITNEIYYSPGWKKILGYQDSDLPNDFSVWEKHTDPEDVRKSFEMLNELTERKRDRFEMEFKMHHKDGHWINILSRATAVFDENGEALRVVGTHVDITELRQAEEAGIQLEEQYHQSQKVESIGRLAGGVAHDLNNLLTPILGYSEILTDDLDPGDTRRESLDEILKAGFRARELVHQLLAFSRKQTLEYKVVDLNEALTGFEKLLRRTIREDIGIEIIPSPDIPTIMADIGQIEQVIMNLVVNAQDAMPDGGCLTIETATADLDEEYTAKHQGVKPGEYVMLAISDTGCGMDEETQYQVFEPFFSTKGEFGTGLGLATVYGIVKQHDGNILVYSEPGKGTIFKVYLPVSREVPVEEEISIKKLISLTGSETILLAEDNEQVRELAHTILKRQGYAVVEAKNGPEALTILAAHEGTVDLLLTDVVMPGMNGRDLFDKVAEKQPDIKVLYMSGYTDDTITHRGVLDEGTSFIQKPFNVQALAVKVREVLDD